MMRRKKKEWKGKVKINKNIGIFHHVGERIVLSRKATFSCQRITNKKIKILFKMNGKKSFFSRIFISFIVRHFSLIKFCVFVFANQVRVNEREIGKTQCFQNASIFIFFCYHHLTPFQHI